MASRGGARAAGTDGTDFSARQRVANQIKLSVQMKFYLKGLFALHFFVLLAMWTKVGSEFARRELGWKSPFFDKLDLPSAYSWEYVWCLSFIPIIFGLLSFTHNKARLLADCLLRAVRVRDHPLLHWTGQPVPRAVGLHLQHGDQQDAHLRQELPDGGRLVHILFHRVPTPHLLADVLLLPALLLASRPQSGGEEGLGTATRCSLV
ncbi:hypothetical protein M3Y99_00966300 [Aphelenchoides fujianensis]|nr:hypothetical protein M3Y99_00966300 [Aphelenchoides fujianensis]